MTFVCLIHICTCTCDNRFLGRTQKPLSRALIHIPLYDLQIVHTSVCILHLVRKRNFCYAVICTKVVHSLPHILFFIETFIFLLTWNQMYVWTPRLFYVYYIDTKYIFLIKLLIPSFNSPFFSSCHIVNFVFISSQYIKNLQCDRFIHSLGEGAQFNFIIYIYIFCPIQTLS